MYLFVLNDLRSIFFNSNFKKSWRCKLLFEVQSLCLDILFIYIVVVIDQHPQKLYLENLKLSLGPRDSDPVPYEALCAYGGTQAFVFYNGTVLKFRPKLL